MLRSSHSKRKHFTHTTATPYATLQVIMRGLRRAGDVAIATLESLSVKATSDEQSRRVLENCAGTALNSKLIASQKGLFAPMIVTAVSLLDPQLMDIKMVGIKKVCALLNC
jgi:T-complex protein 1 subunit eta